MLKSLFQTVANVALDICAAKSLQLNNTIATTREERAKRADQRRTISNVRNACYLAKRLLK